MTFFDQTILKALKDFNSFEIVDLDYSDSSFGIKPIKFEEKYNIIEKIKKQKQNLEDFYDNLKLMVKQNIKDKSEYINLYQKYEMKTYTLNLSQNKEILGKEFNTEEDYYLMFLYLVWYSIKSSYLNEKYKCKLSITDIFDKIINFYNIYLNDKYLEIYEKVLLLYSHVSFFLEKNDIEDYNNAHLKYIKNPKL